MRMGSKTDKRKMPNLWGERMKMLKIKPARGLIKWFLNFQQFAAITIPYCGIYIIEGFESAALIRHERKHEETSASDPDHNYFRSGNSVTSSAETPTLENSESREPINQSFTMPQLRIRIGQHQTEQDQNDDFDLPKIRIKLNLSDEAELAE